MDAEWMRAALLGIDHAILDCTSAFVIVSATSAVMTGEGKQRFAPFRPAFARAWSHWMPIFSA